MEQIITIVGIIILIILMIYIFVITPKMINRADFSKFKNRYYAHRGLHKEKNIAPENSMQAFKLAIKNNYGIELDIQLTKDNIPVVFHDYDLFRLCGTDKKLSDVNYNELKEIYLYNSNQTIPHLKDVLDLVDGKVPLIIELKGETTDTKISSVVASYVDKYSGVYCIESFNPFLIKWFRKNRPDVVIGQLVTQLRIKRESLKAKLRNIMLSYMLMNFLTKPDFIAYNYRDFDNISFKICKSIFNTFSIAYTLKSNEDLINNIDRFDLFIFDEFIPEGIDRI